VRFTPFDVPATMMLAQMTKRMTPTRAPLNARSSPVSRTKEIDVEAGVRNASLGNCSARMAKMTATRVWPASFSPERKPRLRCLEILMKSSRKPMKPSPVMRNRTSRPLTLGL
jgi:hypothetical protein